MRDEVQHRCAEHPDPYDCPEHLVQYVPNFDEYGLIVHDGGASYVEIAYCPWCGTRLPRSKRDRWWAEMERLGIDPWTETPPPAYRTDAWYRSDDPARQDPDPGKPHPGTPGPAPAELEGAGPGRS
jgi:uncharacterized protein DUF6980